jgi:hypothetical protein
VFIHKNNHATVEALLSHTRRLSSLFRRGPL